MGLTIFYNNLINPGTYDHLATMFFARTWPLPGSTSTLTMVRISRPPAALSR